METVQKVRLTKKNDNNILAGTFYFHFWIFFPGSSQTGGLDWRTGDSNGFVSGVGAPAYLSISGYELCLNKYTPNGAAHSQFCLPSKKPFICNKQSWNQLQNVFEGDCPEGKSNKRMK